ncbi:uncharacterized protein ARMOST_11965 [Armillaria ostoyae]|uniref:C2H2-type domain-containing protein n=3 Tax=Armillaria TaxID=47424 RepID=A0A284RIL7_ARMOS|nr:hypothetical protein ARMSODRAFT_954328 [Armillaria solidipes]SJL08599.1 uncharacterized protein ARMOST_11965 [Armillaria ostoyae]
MSNYNHFGNEYYHPYPTTVASDKYVPVSEPFLSHESYYVPNGYVDEFGASSSVYQPGPSVKPNTAIPLHIPFTPSHNTAQVQYEVDEYTDVSAVSRWPQEYNMSFSGALTSSESWTPFGPTTAESTPDLLFSSPSITDDCTNVFDIQFGHSLQSRSQELERSLSPSSAVSPESYPSREVVRPTTTAKKSAPSQDDQSSPRRRHPCLIPGCLRRFTSQYTLKVHMQAHKPKPRVSFLCTLGCGERFSRQHDRLRHEVAKHNKVCEFSCEACGRFFSMAKTLGNHKCPLAQGGTRWVHH